MKLNGLFSQGLSSDDEPPKPIKVAPKKTPSQTQVKVRNSKKKKKKKKRTVVF